MLGSHLQLSLVNRTHTFTSTTHGTNLSSKMLCFYEQQAFCDVTLVPADGGTKIDAHRIVLSASSEFFLRMFSNPMAESKAKEVQITEIDSVTLKLIVDFMYKGNIQLRSDSIEIVLKAADFLQMNVLKDACCDFITEELNASNCLGVSFFAENRNIVDLQQRAYQYACNNFERVYVEEEFLQLTENQLRTLLLSNDLYASSEEHVFHSVVRWVDHNKENREQYVHSLMECIRFTFLDADFLLENRNALCRSFETCNLLCSWVHWFISPSKRKDFKVILPRKRKEKIAFLNGTDSHDMKLQVYDRDLDAWEFMDLPYPQKKRSSYAAIVIKKKLFLVGGRINMVDSASVDYLNLETMEWSSLPPMPAPRFNPKVTTVDGDLYVIGGSIGIEILHTMIKFSFTSNQWLGCAPLRERIPVTAVAAQRHYIFAYSSARHFLDRYNTQEDRWDQRNHNVNQFDQVGFGVVGDFLYAIGGQDPFLNSPTAQAERYWTNINRWAYISTMNSPRAQIRCIALENKLIACGGFDDDYFTTDVEEYDPKTNTWIMLASLLPNKIDQSYANVFLW